MDLSRSDLAVECGATRAGEGVRVQHADVAGGHILRVRVSSPEAAARIGKPEGRYVTLECGNIGELDAREAERVRLSLAVEIRDMAQRMCGGHIGAQSTVLIAGLGNADITPDSLGPLTVSHLMVTRRTGSVGERPFGADVTCQIAALSPGVHAKTGVETVEFLRGAVHAVHPDLLILVDALAARDAARLSATVQLSDTGLCPGSGMGVRTVALDADTLGVPVMAIGVPTVIDSCSLVYDALCEAGYSTLSPALYARLEKGKRLFVAPGDIDRLVREESLLLASALEKAFSHSLLQ